MGILGGTKPEKWRGAVGKQSKPKNPRPHKMLFVVFDVQYGCHDGRDYSDNQNANRCERTI